MKAYADSISDSLSELKGFLRKVGGRPLILSHVDSDGLCAAAILKRFLKRQGITAGHVYPAKGESAFTPGTATRIRELDPDSLFVLDLGSMDEDIAPGVPTLFIDHHRAFGRPENAVVLSSYGGAPSPPTSFVTYDLLSRLADIGDLEWLSAVGTAGDLGSDFVFAHADDIVKKLKKTSVREAEVLINSAKRSSRYDIDTPIELLDEADDICGLIDHDLSRVRLLEEYRAEVNREVKRCRHEPPHFSWKVAVVPFKSACDIQGLIAETWRRQLKKYLVIAANFGYLEGKVTYVIRTELATSVIDFMESIRPAGHDSHVVFGHDRAGGAVLDKEIWFTLIERMGFKNIRQE
jgi:single-stranded-DNA-specific exonuclease